jgi:hypothetical protein
MPRRGGSPRLGDRWPIQSPIGLNRGLTLQPGHPHLSDLTDFTDSASRPPFGAVVARQDSVLEAVDLRLCGVYEGARLEPEVGGTVVEEQWVSAPFGSRSVVLCDEGERLHLEELIADAWIGTRMFAEPFPGSVADVVGVPTHRETFARSVPRSSTAALAASMSGFTTVGTASCNHSRKGFIVTQLVMGPPSAGVLSPNGDSLPYLWNEVTSRWRRRPPAAEPCAGRAPDRPGAGDHIASSGCFAPRGDLGPRRAADSSLADLTVGTRVSPRLRAPLDCTPGLTAFPCSVGSQRSDLGPRNRAGVVSYDERLSICTKAARVDCR